MKLIAGNSNIDLARKISQKTGVPLSKANIGRFLHEILSKNSSDGLQDQGVSLSFPLKQLST